MLQVEEHQLNQIERGETVNEKELQIIPKQSSSFIRSISNELAYLSSLSAHTISGLYNGVLGHSYIANKRGETWTPLYSIQRSLVSALIQYQGISSLNQGHNIQRARFWYSNPITRLLLRHTLPYSVKITPFLVNINQKSLLGAEFDRIMQNIPLNFIYTIPREVNASSNWILTGEWIAYEHSTTLLTDRVILYIHGGAYFTCDASTHRHLIYRYAKECKARVFGTDMFNLVPNYRLAPHHPFPAALHDAFASYLWLVCPSHPSFKCNGFFDTNFPHHNPIDPRNITIMGDSAGAGLALALIGYLKWLGVSSLAKRHLQRYRNPTLPHNISLPNGLVLISPWVDLTCSSGSWIENADVDIIFHLNFFDDIHSHGSKNPVYWYTIGDPKEAIERNYFTSQESGNSHELAEKISKHPLVSPLMNNDLMTDFPPVLVQAGDAEVLKDETLFLTQKLAACNIDLYSRGYIRHELYYQMPHVFPMFPWLTAASVSFFSVGVFVEGLYSGAREQVDGMSGVYDVDAWDSRRGILNSEAKKLFS